jgi:hypothetical protein
MDLLLGNRLLVALDTRWMIVPNGRRVDLMRSGPTRRILAHLVEARIAEPNVARSSDALIDAGWPGEQMLYSAALLRVYSLVRRLRQVGLERVLLTRDDGYLLDPEVPVVRPPSRR